MDLTNLTPEQTKDLAFAFMLAMANEQLSDRDVFYQGMWALMALTNTGLENSQFHKAFERLERLAPRTPVKTT